MSNQDPPEDVVVMELPEEPEMTKELQNLVSVVRDGRDCDIVVDFEDVGIVTSRSLSHLLTLKELQKNRGQKLLLCSMGKTTKGTFTATGIEQLFTFVDDRPSAMEDLRSGAE